VSDHGEKRVEYAGWIHPRLDDDLRSYVRRTGSHTHLFLQDNSAPVTIRTRKFTTNRLLSRRQFIVDVLHPSRPPISRSEISEKLAAVYKADKARIVVFGFKTHFGGGRSTGFALIYDSEESQKKFEPRYRLVRVSGSLPVPASPHLLLTSMFSSFRPDWRPRWRRLPVNYARSARTAQRKYVACIRHRDRAYSFSILPVPWNQKGQGCGASKEGEINLPMELPRLFLYCMSPFSHRPVNGYPSYTTMNIHIWTDRNASMT